MSTGETTHSKQEKPIDPSSIALVDAIIEKTKTNKLYWNKHEGGYTCNVAPAGRTLQMKIDFKCGSLSTWQTFTVWTYNEGPVLKIDYEPLNEVLSRLGVGASGELYQRVSELFSVVATVGESGVDRARKLLDKI